MQEVQSVSYCHQDGTIDSPGTFLILPDKQCWLTFLSNTYCHLTDGPDWQLSQFLQLLGFVDLLLLATFFCGDWSWNIFYGHSLPSADSRRAVVSFWRKTVAVNRLEDKACPVNVWLGKLTELDMTPLGWLGCKTSTQTKQPLLFLSFFFFFFFFNIAVLQIRHVFSPKSTHVLLWVLIRNASPRHF